MSTTHTKAATMVPTTGFSANSVMRSFVSLYYQVVECMPNRLSEIYGESSRLCHGPISAIGPGNIAAVSCTLPLSGKHVEILSMRIQDTVCGFVILIQGSLDNKTFSQVFVLEYEQGSHNNHFVCRNDIFRFLPEYNMLSIRAQDLIPLSKFMSLYPGGDEPLLALDSEYEMPPPVVGDLLKGSCPPEYVPITYGPLSKRKSDVANTCSLEADQEANPKVSRAVSNVVVENEERDPGSHTTALARTVSQNREKAMSCQPSLPLSDVTIENEESSTFIVTKTDDDLVSSPVLSHVRIALQSNRLLEPVASGRTSTSPDSPLSQEGGRVAKKGSSGVESEDKLNTLTRAKRRSHTDRKRSGRAFGPTAVVRLRALRKPLDIKELMGNLRHEFSEYGYAVKRVHVKMRMGLAFVEYDCVDGVDAAVAAWNPGPPKTGKFAGVNLLVFAKKH